MSEISKGKAYLFKWGMAGLIYIMALDYQDALAKFRSYLKEEFSHPEELNLKSIEELGESIV